MQYLIGDLEMIYSILAYGILALGSFFTLFSIRRAKSSPRLNCLLVTAVLFSYLLVRCHFSPIEYLARADYFSILGCLMVYLLTGFYLYQTRPRMIFIFFLLGLALLSVWVGVIQFTWPEDHYVLPGTVFKYEFIRPTGLFFCPNHFAGYLEAVGVMGLSLVWWSRLKLWLKLIVLYASGCCYVGIALSGSRGGYFSSVASLLMFLGLSLNGVRIIDRQKFIRFAFIITLLFGMIVAGILFLMGHSLLLQSRLNNIVTDDTRIYSWMAALDQFKTAPVVGTGSGTYHYFGRLFRHPKVQTNPFHPFSDYLELLAEYGLIGALGMFVFIWIHVKNGIGTCSWLIHKRLLNSFIPRSDTLAFNIGALSAITGLAVHSVVDYNLHIPGNALVFAFIFGLIANPGIENSDPEFASKISRLFRFALPILGIWMGMVGIPKWPSEHFAERSRFALKQGDYEGTIAAGKIAAGEVSANAVWPETWIRLTGGDQSNPTLYFYLAEGYRCLAGELKDPILRREQLLLAVDAFSKAEQLFPQDVANLLRMGQTLDALKRYDEAEILYKRAIAGDPNRGVIYGYYGTHLEVMGKLDESKAAYKKRQQYWDESLDDLGRHFLGL